MANITRISAKDPNKKDPKTAKKPNRPEDSLTFDAPAKVTKITSKPTEKDKKSKSDKTKAKLKAEEKSVKAKKKSDKKVFILFRPFVAFGRYVKASWNELRQVRWPNRKYTWKMTFAMLIYCAFFLILIVILDAIFSLIFNNLLK